MRAMDWVKATGWAVLVMAVNVAAVFAWVWVYSTALSPGQDEAFYKAYAERAAPISAIVVGAPLMFLAAWIASRRRTGAAMALAIVGIYVAIDAAILTAAGSWAAMWPFALGSYVSKGIAAFAGAHVAQRVAAIRSA